jgi:hypothetical protein
LWIGVGVIYVKGNGVGYVRCFFIFFCELLKSKDMG